jgi:hypothetical protein
MRTIWTDIHPGHFDTFSEARRAIRQAVARREALHKPQPMIVKMHGRYLVKGALIVRSFGWSSGAAGGSPREVLVGTPVKPPRPKHRKGKPSPTTIKGPLFRHP